MIIISKMKTIRNCVLIEPFICKENESIIDVAKKLRDISLRHIFVVNEENYPIGIISMTDINNRAVAENRNLENTKAKDIMSNPIDVFDINDSVESVYEKMIEKNHVMDAVVENGKIKGIVTIHQIIKNKEKE